MGKQTSSERASERGLRALFVALCVLYSALALPSPQPN